VLTEDAPRLNEAFSTDPVTSLQWNFAAPDKPTRIKLMDNNGVILLDYQLN
jgi:hypothetical protein